MTVTSRPRCLAEAATSTADPACADHDDRAAPVESCPQRVGVVDAAEVHDAVEVGCRESSSRRGSAPVASSKRS